MAGLPEKQQGDDESCGGYYGPLYPVFSYWHANLQINEVFS